MKDLEQSGRRPNLFEPAIVGAAPSRTSRAIFALLCFLVVSTTILFGGVDQGTWVVITVCIGSVGILWVADAWFGKAFLFNRDVIVLPLIGLILVGLIQVLPLFAPETSTGILASPHRSSISLDPYSTRLLLVRLVEYTIFFAAALTFVNSEKRLRTIAALITLFGSLMAFFGILQRLANPEGIYGIRGTPQAIPFGPFVNQHHFAAFMVMCAGVTLGFLFARDTSREKRLLLLVAAVLMGMATLMTSSRGGLIGLVATLGFVLIATLFARREELPVETAGTGRDRRTLMVAYGTGFLILIFGAVLFLGEDNAVIRGIGLAGRDDFSNGRSHFWSAAIRIFLDHPFIGVGFDAFGVAFTKYDSWPGVFRVEQVHNDYLQTLTDTGILGFICVAAFIYFLFAKGVKVIRETRSSYRRALSIGALAGCFGILIHSFFDFPLRTPSNAFVFLMLATVAIVDVNFRRSSER